jgi:hypothetical protein
MRPRRLAQRIVAVLAAYAVALAVIIGPLPATASRGVGAGCLAAVESTGGVPVLPDRDHGNCGQCVFGCAGGPAFDRVADAVLLVWPFSSRVPRHAPVVVPPPHIRGTAALARAPPRSA